MKRSLLFVLTLTVILSAMVFCSVTAQAAVESDPNNLTPGSNRVLFIKDPNAYGQLEGDGSGMDANNPLEALDHELFDPMANYPKYYLQTAFYQATEMLKDTGGTIVVCGPVFLGANQSYGSGSTTRDVFSANFGARTIKITSVYNGVDYRETNGAKITIASPAMVGINGQTIWENIDIETEGINRAISFNYWPTLIGDGVRCYPRDKAFEGLAQNYVSLSAGHRYQGGVDLSTNLVVKSGSYNAIAAGMWGVNNSRKYTPDGYISWTNNMDGNSVTNLVLEGTTTVYGQVIGTNRMNAEYSGNVNINIKGGNYNCDIYGVGPSGVINDYCTVNIKISGGNFQKIWSISPTAFGYTNKAPAYSLLDLSEWNGSEADYRIIKEYACDFSDIKENNAPDGWILNNDSWYYYENGILVKNNWRLDSIGWCYLGENGAMKTSSWIADSVGWCYVDESGYCVSNTFVNDSVGMAYIGSDERMVTTTGWILHDGQWYYLENGYAVINDWRLDSVGWCYLGETGLMVTNGFVPDSKGLCFIGGEGYMITATDWILYNDQWYYLENGYSVTNDWRLDSKGWCYLGEDGAMYTSTWLKDSVGWCYIDENGYCLTNGTYTVDGREYTFDENGRIQGEPIFAE